MPVYPYPVQYPNKLQFFSLVVIFLAIFIYILLIILFKYVYVIVIMMNVNVFIKLIKFDCLCLSDGLVMR